MNKQAKTSTILVVGAVALIAILGLIAWQVFLSPTQQSILTGTPSSGSSSNVAVNPTASYATVDKYGTTTVSGLDYYKQGDTPVTRTSYSNVNPGSTYTYWVSNTTYYVQPITFTAGTLNNPVINKNAYQNTTITFTVYDTGNRQTVSASAYNATLAANGQLNFELDYQPVSKKSFMPFGGLLVADVNSTISTITCSGEGVTAGIGDKHLTYTVTSTAHKYLVFTIPANFDDGVNTAMRKINCQIQNGGNAIGNDQWTFKVIPFNYYVTNDGNILLDAEKYANQDTTRTGFGSQVATGYFS